MQIRIYFSALNIDDLGKKWGVRIFYALLTLANFFFLFFPIGDSDFTRVFNWYEDYFANPEKYIMADEITLPPFSSGNVLYIVSVAVVRLIMILVAVCYASIFVYSKRLDKANVSKSFVVKRTLLMCLFIILLYPYIFLFMASSSILLVAIMPIVSLLVCSFISGDFGMGASFKNAFKSVKGTYFGMIINFIVIYLITSLLRSGVDLFNAGNAYYSIVCVLAAALESYTYLVLGRLMGTIYLDSKRMIPNRMIIKNGN